MIAPLKSLSEFSKPVTKPYENLTFVSICVGLIFSTAFSLLWTDLVGISQMALWPLGFALSFVVVSLLAVRRYGKMRWDLLFFGQVLGVIGAIMFFFATI